MIRTSVSLPEDVASELKRLGPDLPRRSNIVARALRAYFESDRHNHGDLAILDAHGRELNEEAQDVLEFQRLP